MLGNWKYELDSGFQLKEVLATSENPVTVVKEIEKCYIEMLEKVDGEDEIVVQLIQTNREMIMEDLQNLEEHFGVDGADLSTLDEAPELQNLIAMLIEMRLHQFIQLCDDERFLIKH